MRSRQAARPTRWLFETLPTAWLGAGAGQRIDGLLDEVPEIQREIALRPAVTLQDAAVKLRRLSVYLEDQEPARLLSRVLKAVERAAEPQP